MTVNGWSDWSVVRINAPDVLKLSARRVKEAVHIEYAEGINGELKMMRLAYLPTTDSLKAMMVGILCASPSNVTQGFDISFVDLNISVDRSTNASGSVDRSHTFLFLMHLLLIFTTLSRGM